MFRGWSDEGELGCWRSIRDVKCMAVPQREERKDATEGLSLCPEGRLLAPSHRAVLNLSRASAFSFKAIHGQRLGKTTPRLGLLKIQHGISTMHSIIKTAPFHHSGTLLAVVLLVWRIENRRRAKSALMHTLITEFRRELGTQSMEIIAVENTTESSR